MGVGLGTGAAKKIRPTVEGEVKKPGFTEHIRGDMRIEINIIAGPAKGKTFIFDRPDCLLCGRDPEVEIALPEDPRISRQHFLLSVSALECRIIDLDSKNGLLVNGIRYGGRTPAGTGVKRAPNEAGETRLKNGDEIAVGDTRMKICIQLDERTETVDIPVFSIIQPTSSREVALFVLDLVHSTRYVLEFGDTYFSALIGNIYQRVKNHPSASDLIFLKCMGDGFLSVFTTVPAAFSMAASFLKTPVHQDISIRMALHRGIVKTGPDGDVLGTEVHRVCRIEGVNAQDQIELAGHARPLPMTNRILITKQGLEQLDISVRRQFRLAGKFRLKGFNEVCELWVLHR